MLKNYHSHRIFQPPTLVESLSRLKLRVRMGPYQNSTANQKKLMNSTAILRVAAELFKLNRNCYPFLGFR